MFSNLSKPECYWVATIKGSARPFPALDGDIEADTVVIGAGIVGLSAAARLIGQGQRVVVLEALEIGRQVTGHSTAKITSQHGLIYQQLEKDFGQEKAALYAEANQTAIEEIAGLVTRHEIECGFERKDAYVYARSDEGKQGIKAEAESAARAGLPSSFVEKAPLPFANRGAIRFADQAQFNPCRYLTGLAQGLEQQGCRIFENTRVTDVGHGTPCKVKTSRGFTVTAHDVVMATHMPIGKTGMYFAKAYPYVHPMIAARIAPDRAPDGMFISMESPVHSVRTARSPDGTAWLIGVGNSFKPGHSHKEQESFEDLRSFVGEHFGITEIDYYWTNQDYNSMDGLPFIGRSDEHLFVATGFNAWGITTGTAAGAIIGDLIAGRENRWAGLFDASRLTPLKGGKTFMKENLEVAKHLVKGYLEDRPETADAVAPGEGHVIGQDGKEIGIYRDESGEVHAVSAICTHLGCVLGWNKAERTWDCHCHGSRFTYDGKLLHGPATTDLEKKSPGGSS